MPSDISQLEKSLKKLTANALTRLDKDILSVKILSERYYKLIDNKNHILDTIFQLIEDCKNYGTLAFAHAARAGFVAVTLLKSLVKLGNLSQDRMLEFQSTIPTVASDFQNALSSSQLLRNLQKNLVTLDLELMMLINLLIGRSPTFIL